jgi:hypothetical protein
LWGIHPIAEDFRYLDQSYTFSETDSRGRQVEETKHFHLNEGYGSIVERTIIKTDGTISGREIAWWYTDENQNNHFRVELLNVGTLLFHSIGTTGSGYKGVGMNESENGWRFASQVVYSNARGGKLRTARGTYIARGLVNDTIFNRKTWSRIELELDAFNQLYRSEEAGDFELSENMAFLQPLLGRWEGKGNDGRDHLNLFVKISPNWMLEFFTVGDDENGFRGINIIGTDTLRGGSITRSSMGRRGFRRTAGNYVPVKPGTLLQFQNNGNLIRSVSGNRMTITRQVVEGTDYVKQKPYVLTKAN